jgi:hypothetical protein
MKVRRLAGLHPWEKTPGHTEVEVSVDEIIAETERQMNAAGGAKACTVLVEEPGKESVRVDDLTTLPTKHPDSQVWVIPQMVGG